MWNRPYQPPPGGYPNQPPHRGQRQSFVQANYQQQPVADPEAQGPVQNSLATVYHQGYMQPGMTRQGANNDSSYAYEYWQQVDVNAQFPAYFGQNAPSHYDSTPWDRYDPNAAHPASFAQDAPLVQSYRPPPQILNQYPQYGNPDINYQQSTAMIHSPLSQSQISIPQGDMGMGYQQSASTGQFQQVQVQMPNQPQQLGDRGLGFQQTPLQNRGYHYSQSQRGRGGHSGHGDYSEFRQYRKYGGHRGPTNGGHWHHTSQHSQPQKVQKKKKECDWCKKEGHTIRSCVQNCNDNGFAEGCGPCNDRRHNYRDPKCPFKYEENSDFHFLVASRHHRPLAKSKTDVREVAKFYSSSFRPWTPAFAKQMKKAGCIAKVEHHSNPNDTAAALPRDTSWDNVDQVNIDYKPGEMIDKGYFDELRYKELAEQQQAQKAQEAQQKQAHQQAQQQAQQQATVLTSVANPGIASIHNNEGLLLEVMLTQGRTIERQSQQQQRQQHVPAPAAAPHEGCIVQRGIADTDCNERQEPVSIADIITCHRPSQQWSTRGVASCRRRRRHRRRHRRARNYL